MSMVVVSYGEAKQFVRVAHEAGANGATILHARGAYRSERERLFSVTFEPEQEIILIVATKEVTKRIGERILQECTGQTTRAALYILPVTGLDAYSGK